MMIQHRKVHILPSAPTQTAIPAHGWLLLAVLLCSFILSTSHAQSSQLHPHTTPPIAGQHLPMPGLAHPHTLQPHTLQYSYDIEHSYEIQQQYDVHYEFDIAYEFSYEFGQPSLFFPQHSNLRQPLRPLQGPTTVIRVVSGDTLRMLFDVGEAGARLIGINAPERQAPFFSEPFADEAKRFVENLIGGRRVWIELDEQLRDAAGNFLIYLYVEDPQGDWEWQGRRFSQVNLLLAQQGLATIGVFEPNDSYSVLYNVAVQQAVAAQVGKWQSRH